jgi:tetratricopeptide (TPR) repeat protein
MKLWNGLFFSGALLLSCHAVADNKPANVTAGEIALLPAYCIDTESMGGADVRYSPQSKLWKAQLGETFMALHHYCWGLIRVSRASQAGVSAMERKAHYNGAIGDYQYVLEAAGNNVFLLTPEIELRIGEAYLELQNYPAAVEAFARSIRAKPDYWPAYHRWAGMLTRLGKKRDAMNKLEEGLRVLPTEPALVSAYEKIGGNHKAFVKSLPPVALAPAILPPQAASAKTPPPDAPAAAPAASAATVSK